MEILIIFFCVIRSSFGQFGSETRPGGTSTPDFTDFDTADNFPTDSFPPDYAGFAGNFPDSQYFSSTSGGSPGFGNFNPSAFGGATNFGSFPSAGFGASSQGAFGAAFGNPGFLTETATQPPNPIEKFLLDSECSKLN